MRPLLKETDAKAILMNLKGLKLITSIFVKGTFAIISLMVGETVDSQVDATLPLNYPNGTSEDIETQLRVKYAVTCSFFVGVIQVRCIFLGF